jgi:hypothetical protein
MFAMVRSSVKVKPEAAVRVTVAVYCVSGKNPVVTAGDQLTVPAVNPGLSRLLIPLNVAVVTGVAPVIG